MRERVCVWDGSGEWWQNGMRANAATAKLDSTYMLVLSRWEHLCPFRGAGTLALLAHAIVRLR